MSVKRHGTKIYNSSSNCSSSISPSSRCYFAHPFRTHNRYGRRRRRLRRRRHRRLRRPRTEKAVFFGGRTRNKFLLRSEIFFKVQNSNRTFSAADADLKKGRSDLIIFVCSRKIFHQVRTILISTFCFYLQIFLARKLRNKNEVNLRSPIWSSELAMWL